MLEPAKWQTVSWRRGTKGRLSAIFSALRVRVADGTPQRIHDIGAQHLPGEEVWLVGEHRPTGERKYYLSNLPPRHQDEASRRCHQGALDLRAGASATQGRARA
jgi:SRSO17 transposase